MTNTTLLVGSVLALAGFGVGYYAAYDPTALPQIHAQAPAAPDGAATPPPPYSDESGTEGAILAVLRELDPFERAASLSALLQTLGAEDVDAVRAALVNPSVDRGTVEITLLAQFWGQHDPEAATFWALRQSPIVFRPAMILATMELWAAADPHAASGYLDGMRAMRGPSQSAAETGFIRGWFDGRAPGVETYIRDLGIGQSRQRALSVLVRRAIQRYGPEAAMRWARDLPDEPAKFKLAAFRQVGSELAQMAPPAAAAWCDAVCDGPFGANVRSLIAQRWAGARRGGAATLQWVASAPEGKEKEYAVQAAFRGWWRNDRAGLAEWMDETCSDGVAPWIQPALEAYAVWHGRKEPEVALRWAPLIENEQARERAYVEIARAWRREDEPAAEAWLLQSPLSEEARERARIVGKNKRDNPPAEKQPDA